MHRLLDSPWQPKPWHVLSPLPLILHSRDSDLVHQHDWNPSTCHWEVWSAPMHLNLHCQSQPPMWTELFQPATQCDLMNSFILWQTDWHTSNICELVQVQLHTCSCTISAVGLFAISSEEWRIPLSWCREHQLNQMPAAITTTKKKDSSQWQSVSPYQCKC